LYDAFGQRQIATLYTQTNQYHVILEADPKFQTGIDRLSDIYLQGASSTSSSSGSNGGSGSSGQSGVSSSSSTNSQLSVSSTNGVSATTSNTSTLATTTANSQLSSSVQSGAISGSTLSSTVLQTFATNGNASSLNTTSASNGQGGGGAGSSGPSNSANGRHPVPLASFTSIGKALTPLTVNRQSQFPVITISFNLAPGVHLSQAVNAVNKVTADLKMPINVQTKFQGTAASYENSLTNEGLLVIAALITVYIVLGVLYESFIHPLTILSTLPSAGVGALLALTLFRMDLGIVGIIGIVLLIGIVKKNGIMMVDFALNAERAEGKTPEEAIYTASLLRFRPIMMTTLAALFGGLPLALGHGIGAELRRPLGVAMVGGLLLSQVLTLYTTPVIYLWFDSISQKLQRRKKSTPAIQRDLPLGGEA
jgi:multidrug efflux pump